MNIVVLHKAWQRTSLPCILIVKEQFKCHHQSFSGLAGETFRRNTNIPRGIYLLDRFGIADSFSSDLYTACDIKLDYENYLSTSNRSR